VLEKTQWFLHRIETYLLAALLMSLLLVSVAQIGMRIFFDSGFIWAEAVGRQGVLWLALLGALGATRAKKHIAIDALPRVLPVKLQRLAWSITQLAAAIICGAMAWFGWGMAALEREAPGTFIAEIPSWWPMCIFVAGFALISLRLLFAALSEPPEPGA
jgi:C4-dicarboxylate transporter, DctQ subunit